MKMSETIIGIIIWWGISIIGILLSSLTQIITKRYDFKENKQKILLEMAISEWKGRSELTKTSWGKIYH